MKQAITLILAVYIIVYLVVSIYNKPNFEFFLGTNNIPNEPRHVRANFDNGGIKVNWSHPRNTDNVLFYEIYLEDVRNSNNRIAPVVVRGENDSRNPTFTIRNSAILADRQYRISMKTVNANGRSIISNRVITNIPGNSGSNAQLSGSTTQAMDAETRRFKEQEAEQNIQNREISDLKKRVDSLRNDIVIMKNKDKEENASLQNRVELDDTVSQLPASVRDRFGIPSQIELNFTLDPSL